MITLTSAEVETLLSIPDAIDLIHDAMIVASNGGATLPLRHAIDVGAPNLLGIMPGALSDPAVFGTKLISLFPNNPADGYSSHLGLMVLFERAHGTPTAIMNAGILTAIRTSAATAVATRALARDNATTLAIIGTGEQAAFHIASICAVRDIKNVHIAGRTPQSAAKFVDNIAPNHPGLAITACNDVKEAVRNADIICTVTSSHETILCGEWVPDGCHVNAVGASIPIMREIDETMITRARLFVDYRPSALNQARDIIEAIKDGAIDDTHIIAEIGEVLDDRINGRQSDGDITLYRSMGIAAQDLTCAHHVMEQAIKRGVGTTVSIL